MSASDIVKLVQFFGIPLSLSLAAVWAFATGRLHGDKEFQREVKRADKFEELAFRGVHAAEAGTEVAQQLAAQRKRRTTALAEAIAEALARKEEQP